MSTAVGKKRFSDYGIEGFLGAPARGGRVCIHAAQQTADLLVWANARGVDFPTESRYSDATWR